MGVVLRKALTLPVRGSVRLGGEIISLNCCKMLQINRAFFQVVTHQGCQLPARWGGNTPSCAIRPSIAADYTAALTPNPEGTAPLSPALDRPGQRGSGPTLGKRRIMPPNPEGGCICLSTHRLGFPLWAPLFRSARMGRLGGARCMRGACVTQARYVRSTSRAQAISSTAAIYVPRCYPFRVQPGR
jgi:hypothetical protein